MKAATFSLALCLALVSCAEPDNGPTTDGKIPTPPPELNSGDGAETNDKSGEGSGEKPKPKGPTRIEISEEGSAAVKERAELIAQILEVFKQVVEADDPIAAALEKEEELTGLYTNFNQLKLKVDEGVNFRLEFELTRRKDPAYRKTYNDFTSHLSLIRGLNDETTEMIERVESAGKDEGSETGTGKVENLLEKLNETPVPTEGGRRPAE